MNKELFKTRLKTFFTYDLLKVAGICLGFCVVFTLAFYIAEKKATEGQRFTILYADDLIVGEEADNVIINAIDEESENALSYDVLVIEPKQIEVGNESAMSLLNTYSELCDDDVFICTSTLLEHYVQSTKEIGRAHV